MATHTGPKAVFETALTDTSTKDREGVGTLRWDGESCYRWVKNSTGSATVAGECVVHDMSARADTTLFHEIDDGQTTDLGMMAGITLSVCASLSYCWIQVCGVCTSCIASNDTTVTVAIGDYMVAVTGAVYLDIDANAQTQPSYHRNVQSLESIATASSATTYIVGVVNCLG